MADERPPLPPGMEFPPPSEARRVEPTPEANVEPPSMPAIVLNPGKEPKGASKTIPKIPSKESETKDTIRELMETVVFVVVLVLMLKTFLAEAFVIPTGSMADTLLGYHYKVTCNQCGYRNLVNASSEAEPQRGEQGLLVVSCQCQNCGETNIIRNVPQPRQGGHP